MCPATYLSPMILLQKIIIAIEMMTRNQKGGIYSTTCRTSSPGKHCTNNSGEKLSTSYFYHEAKFLQQGHCLISLPGEH